MTSTTNRKKVSVHLRGFTNNEGSPDQLPPAPESLMVQVIDGKFDTAADRQQLSAFDMLDETTQAQALLEAEKLLDVWLNNTMAMIEYGKPVIKKMNDLIDEQRRRISVVEVPELRELMLRLNKDMRRVGDTFDISNSKVLERLEAEISKARGIFAKANSTVETLILQSQSMDGSFEEIEGVVDEAMVDMLQNVSAYDDIIRGSEIEMMNLVGVLGVLESVRDLALQKMERIEVDPDDLSMNKEYQERLKLREFHGLLEKKIAEYKNRLVQSRMDTGEILDARRVTVDSYQQFDAVEDFVIPRMKKTLLQYQRYLETYSHTKTAQIIIEIGNEWYERSSQNARSVLPQIAANASTLTSSKETMQKVIENGFQRTQALLDIHEAARQKQRDLEDLFARSQRLSQVTESEQIDSLLDEHARLSSAHSRLGMK